MTLSLITSACQGNFVKQNRNALFWRECDPRARPGKKKRVQRELNVTVARCFKKKKTTTLTQKTRKGETKMNPVIRAGTKRPLLILTASSLGA